MLLDLPRECLVEVFRCLPPRDVLRIQSVNKTLRDVARQREVWEPRLSAEFGVRLTVRTRVAGSGNDPQRLTPTFVHPTQLPDPWQRQQRNIPMIR